MKSNVIGLALLALLAVGFAGCEKEGPAEKAGAKIDQAVDDAGDAVERAGDKVEQATDN